MVKPLSLIVLTQPPVGFELQSYQVSFSFLDPKLVFSSFGEQMVRSLPVTLCSRERGHFLYILYCQVSANLKYVFLLFSLFFCLTYIVLIHNIFFLFHQSGGFRVSRNGSVMLTFFPAVGQRKYDYTKKQVRISFR
jgi:hypothetical protein